MSQPGSAEPDYDTLIGLANFTSTSQTARVKVYNQAGTLQLWSGVDHKDIPLTAGHSIAFTFIPGNPYNDVPLSWKGYMTVESITGGPLAVLANLGGGGCYPAYWNTYSAQLAAIPGPLAPRAVSLFPFANIHWVGDLNHPNGYATGMAITNFDSITVTFKSTWTIGDGYAGAGTTYSWTDVVAPNNSVSWDVYTRAHAAGLTANLQEGNLKIEAQNANGALVAVKQGVCMTQADSLYATFSNGYCF